jgi:hypothetical protein
MAEAFILDSDVLLKACRYDLVDQLLNATRLSERRPAIVAAARYPLRRRAERQDRTRPGVAARMSVILASLEWIEPDSAELVVAAELEEAAMRAALALDAGESLLFAIVFANAAMLGLTGDKRAIAALAKVRPHDNHRRFACFEQLLATMLIAGGQAEILPRICAEPDVDRSACLCFACHSAPPDTAAILTALSSYIEALRADAPFILLPGTDWSAKIAKEDGIGRA